MMKERTKIKRFMIYLDEKYMKRLFGGRKRRVHELSVDNPVFREHYEQYQTKQMEKAANTRLWASGPPTIGRTTFGDHRFISPAYNSDHGRAYDTIKTIKSAPNEDPQLKYESIGDGSSRIKGFGSSPITHSLPIHEYIDHQRQSPQINAFDGMSNHSPNGNNLHSDCISSRGAVESNALLQGSSHRRK